MHVCQSISMLNACNAQYVTEHISIKSTCQFHVRHSSKSHNINHSMFTPKDAKGCSIRTSTASNYLKSKLRKSELAPEHQHTMHKFRERTNNSRPCIRTHGWDFTYTNQPSILPKQLNRKLKTRLGTRFHNRIRKLPARTTHSRKTSSFAYSFQLTTASKMGMK
ncbi:hypothetical protein F511_46096 [Dorcoceras hygrometricum]|uniref:Uncharacterized protein n=1 Tax=Dorcoceras hygrometricum TaxID=472368 RepID=A0A2Z6ZUV1_9LAMI|nr:hypothetical protein F511_46096 [Dorcoceras hygrometricum]